MNEVKTDNPIPEEFMVDGQVDTNKMWNEVSQLRAQSGALTEENAHLKSDNETFRKSAAFAQQKISELSATGKGFYNNNEEQRKAFYGQFSEEEIQDHQKLADALHLNQNQMDTLGDLLLQEQKSLQEKNAALEKDERFPKYKETVGKALDLLHEEGNLSDERYQYLTNTAKNPNAAMLMGELVYAAFSMADKYHTQPQNTMTAYNVPGNAHTAPVSTDRSAYDQATNWNEKFSILSRKQYERTVEGKEDPDFPKEFLTQEIKKYNHLD